MALRPAIPRSIQIPPGRLRRSYRLARKSAARRPRVRFAKMFSAASAVCAERGRTMRHRAGGGGARSPSGVFPPQSEGWRSADKRWCGSPHPVARLAAKPVPPAGGNSRPITRTGAPIGASPRRFSFVLGTAFWKGKGAAIAKLLDPTGFHPLLSAPPARYRTDPRSWAGQCLPRPPEVRLRRPNPQAPHPAPSTSATG